MPVIRNTHPDRGLARDQIRTGIKPLPLLVQLAGLWIARDIAAGKYPPKLAIPLSLLISRLGAPGLLAGVVGLALDRYSELKKDGVKRRPVRRKSRADDRA